MKLEDELSGWEAIIGDAGAGNDDRRTQAQVKAVHKAVLAIVNLGNNIFSLQKVSGTRLEELQKSIDRFNESSSKLYIVYLWLTGVIVILTLLNVILFAMSLYKK